MNAKLYKKSAQPRKPINGQALVVWNHMSSTPELAKTILARVVESGQLKTTQDKYRVVLYYILVFKSKGLVEAVEPAENVAVEPSVDESQLSFAGM